MYYCAPLRLMAREIFDLAASKNIPCDLITGEEVIMASPNEEYSEHFSCTVYCADLDTVFDVVVIDEVQGIGDPESGWAFTQALLGVQAKHIILCGDETALDLVEKILQSVGEKMLKEKHKRPTELKIVESLSSDFSKVEKGDCIVCFNKRDIRYVARELARENILAAVIYGSLPPSVKKGHAEAFNKIDQEPHILVATDAVGMGLNFSIKRIVFYDLVKPTNMVDENDGPKRQGLTSAVTIQIAGRAGRMKKDIFYFGYDGEVTTFHDKDHATLKDLLTNTPEPVTLAGFRPTTKQLQALELFETAVEVNEELYFLCSMKDLKRNSCLLETVKMKFDEKFHFSCAPISGRSSSDLYNYLVKLAKLHTDNEKLTLEGFLTLTGFEKRCKDAHSISDLEDLEELGTLCTLYQWLGTRFRTTFPDSVKLKQLEEKVNLKLTHAINDMGNLEDLRATVTRPMSGAVASGRPARRSRQNKSAIEDLFF